MRGRNSGIAGNPVLIGAATVLVTVVAVFLAYNANQGLPFVPTYSLTFETANAANLVAGNEVRIGGTRVGAITEILPARKPDGSTTALIKTELDQTVDPLPEDSTFVVRPRSVLGLKYVEITRGRAREGFDGGATVPMSANRPPQVEFDEFLNMFDERTREGIRGSTAGAGDVFAGRGPSINLALVSLRPLLRDIVPVMENLSDPETRLPRLIGELADAARIVAPAAEQQADLFVNLDRTFGALAEVTDSIQETISEGPETLETGIRELPGQRAFLRNSELLFAELRPGARALRDAAPDLGDALVVGQPTLRRAIPFNRNELTPLLRALQEFAEDPVVPRGLRRLDQLAESLNPTLRYLAPTQTVCNYAALWFRNVASLLSEGDPNGTWQRFIIIATPQGPNNEGGPASAPADGPTEENHFHVNPYPHTSAPGQPAECEAANEPYASGETVLTNPPGRQSQQTERVPRRGGS